jgi:hypothetical protein
MTVYTVISFFNYSISSSADFEALTSTFAKLSLDGFDITFSHLTAPIRYKSESNKDTKLDKTVDI